MVDIVIVIGFSNRKEVRGEGDVLEDGVVHLHRDVSVESIVIHVQVLLWVDINFSRFEC